MFTHQIVQPFKDLLDSQTLASFSLVNRRFREETCVDRTQRRQMFVQQVLDHFYISSHNMISIGFQFTDSDYVLAKRLLQFLPELFQFISKKNVQSLHLSPVTLYGGSPENPRNYIQQDIHEHFIHMIDLISENRTLKSVNVGIYCNFIARSYLEEKLTGHPILRYVCTISERASKKMSDRTTMKINDTIEWV
jgi:hypothetical protein